MEEINMDTKSFHNEPSVMSPNNKQINDAFFKLVKQPDLYDNYQTNLS